jgi:hypothetical protein
VNEGERVILTSYNFIVDLVVLRSCDCQYEALLRVHCVMRY